jgi:hypothetical protein
MVAGRKVLCLGERRKLMRLLNALINLGLQLIAAALAIAAIPPAICAAVILLLASTISHHADHQVPR